MSNGQDSDQVTMEWIPNVFNEAARQRALRALNIANSQPEERFDRITRLAAQLLGVEAATITLIDNDRVWLKSRFGTKLTDVDRVNSFSDFTIRASELFEINDASKDPRFRENPLVLGEPYIRFFAAYPLEAVGGAQIGALCVFDSHPRIFENDERSLLHELKIWVQTELTLEEEITRAARVQRSLLPQQPLIIEGYDVAGGCAHVQEVGGDFYDWYPVVDGHAFTLADVMGKGMAAAIIAATVRAILRAGSRNHDLVKTIELATAMLEVDLHNAESFVTLFHARLDSQTGFVRFIDAGHGLSMVYREDGTAQRLTSENFPLGAGISTTWEEHNLTLEPGDTLVSISDGVLDLFDGTIGGLERVENIIRYSTSAQEAVNKLIALANHSASDDATVLIIHRTNKSS